MSDSHSKQTSRLRWGLLLVGAVVFVAAGVGAAYETLEARRDARRFPQRGKSIDIGGLRLNLNCTGSARPTVILESGLGVSSLGWINVQPEIAKYARVCSYDRAGYGWSELGKEPRTALQIAKELKALLEAANEEGPYVLVGPSFGGFIVRVFAGQYPADVAGMILVEASHEDQRERVDRIISPEAKRRRASDEKREKRHEQLDRLVEPVASFFGINRLRSALDPDTSPPPFGWSKTLMDEFRYLDNQPKTRQTVAAEDARASESGNQARSAGNIGDRPLIVLTGGRMTFRPDPLTSPEIQAQLRDLWITGLQGQLAKLSTRGRQIVLKDSGHLVQFERPDAVISAVHEVWLEASARN
jgi:pimeloyl-ACP methyl ester carboxylesterase